MRSIIRPLVLALSTVWIGVHTVDAQDPDPGQMCTGESVVVVHDTTPDCNCTGGPADVEICHSETVEITVGGDVGSASTGKSTEACITQEKEHGECLYWRYVFECCHSFWGGWSCTLMESQAKSSTSTCEV